MAEQNPEATVTLHWLDQSRSQRIAHLLEELHAPYNLAIYKRGSDFLAPSSLKSIHPLGKSPVISVSSPSLSQDLVIPESGLIVEYLVDHWPEGKNLVPKRWKEGVENTVGGETEEWLRYRYYMHYAEGSLMTLLLITIFVGMIKSSPQTPFFLKPITRAIGTRVETAYLNRNLALHFDFLESQLKTAPGVSDSESSTEERWLCGKNFSAADIMMSFPLELAKDGITNGVKLIDEKKYPLLCRYVECIRERPLYKKSVERVEKEMGGKMESKI